MLILSIFPACQLPIHASSIPGTFPVDMWCLLDVVLVDTERQGGRIGALSGPHARNVKLVVLYY